MQLPVDIPDLIPSGPRGSEEGDSISCGILQLRVNHQCMRDDNNRARNIPRCQVSQKKAANDTGGRRAH